MHPRRRGAPDPAWGQVSVAMIAIGSLLLAVDVATAPARATSSGLEPAPNTPILIAGLSIAALGVLSCLLMAVAALIRRNEDRRPACVVTHDPQCSECRGLEADGSQTIRLEVSNVSGGGVQRVRCFMRVLEGHARSYFLHLQHDNEPQHLASRGGEYLTVGQVAHFDIASANVAGKGLFYFYYADADLRGITAQRAVGNQSWRFEIEASGWTDFRDVVPASKEFRLTLNDQHELSLTTL